MRARHPISYHPTVLPSYHPTILPSYHPLPITAYAVTYKNIPVPSIPTHPYPSLPLPNPHPSLPHPHPTLPHLRIDLIVRDRVDGYDIVRERKVQERANR